MQFIIPFAISLLTLLDVITRPEGETKHLPKMVWILLVIFLPIIGPILWFAVGREYPQRPVNARQRPMKNRPLNAPASDLPTPAFDRRTTEQQLADLDREIEEDRLRAEIARKRAERGEA